MNAGLRAARGGLNEAGPGRSCFFQQLAGATGVETASEGAKGHGRDDSPEQEGNTTANAQGKSC